MDDMKLEDILNEPDDEGMAFLDEAIGLSAPLGSEPGSATEKKSHFDRQVDRILNDEDEESANFFNSLSSSYNMQIAGPESLIPKDVEQAENLEKAPQQGGSNKVIDVSSLLWECDNSEGSIMLPTPLPRIAQILASPEIGKRDIGYPSCIACSKHICIGTTHGLSLIFNRQQVLTKILGRGEHQDFGAVTSMHVSSSNEWLACGYQSGHIVIYDLNKDGAIVKVISDNHTGAIMFIRFLKSGTEFISVCLNGAVYLNQITSMLLYYSVSFVKILDGSGGRILSLAALSPGTIQHKSDMYELITLASAKTVLIVALKPQIKILQKIPRPSVVPLDSALPYLSWRCAFAKAATKGRLKSFDPLLVIGWGNVIQTIQVIVTQNPSSPIDFKVISTFHGSVAITGLQWIGNELVVVHTTKDELVAIDPIGMKELESMEASNMELIYHIKFCSADTSILSADPGLFSYHNSMTALASRVFLLGMKQVYCLELIGWEERVDMLYRQGKWLEALSLCLQFHTGNAKGVVDLPSNLAQMQQLTGDKIESILVNKIEQELKVSKTPEMIKRTQILGSLAIYVCVAIKRNDVLFSDIFPKFKEKGHRDLFLELLEPFIVNDKLRTLNPEVMQSFVELYQERNLMGRVELCIVHMDISSLDFHQIVTLCRTHSLSSALIYVYNRGMSDFTTPIEELLKMMKNQADEGNKKKIGYKLLLYIKYCLNGRSFPTGVFPKKQQREVKAKVIQFLFSRDAKGIELSDSKEKMSVLRSLAKLDAKETANVLSSVFDDTLFRCISSTSTPALEKANASSSSVISQESDMLTHAYPNHQQIIDSLLSLVIPAVPDPFARMANNKEFSASEQIPLLALAVRYYARGTVELSNPVLQNIMAYSLLTEDSSTAEERETILLDLVRVCPPNAYDEERILLLAEGHKFFRIIEFFYLRSKNYSKVLQCYLMDSKRNNLVFDFIRVLVDSPLTNTKEKNEIKDAILRQLTALIEVDSARTSQLIIGHFVKEHDEVMVRLKDHPKLQYEYLRSILLGEDEMNDLLERSGIVISTNMHETFISLMCQFAPNEVYKYLLTHNDYRLDHTLQICKNYDIFDANSYLLERTGDLQGALKMILDKLKSHIKKLSAISAAKSNAYHEMSKKEQLGIETSTRIAIQLCQRNSKENDVESEELWFSLLDTVVLPLRKIKTKKNRKIGLNALSMQTREAKPEEESKLLKDTLTRYLGDIMQAMMGCVSLKSLLQKIVKDHGADEFRDFKSILLAMLDTYHYEKNILQTATHLLQGDVYSTCYDLFKQRKRGFKPKHLNCGICKRKLGKFVNVQTGVKATAMFPCGHGFHAPCLGKAKKTCPQCTSDIVEEKKAAEHAGSNNNTPNRAENNASPLPTDCSRTDEYLKRADVFIAKSSQKLGVGPQLQLAPPPSSNNYEIRGRIPGRLPPQPLKSASLSPEEAYQLKLISGNIPRYIDLSAK